MPTISIRCVSKTSFVGDQYTTTTPSFSLIANFFPLPEWFNVSPEAPKAMPDITDESIDALASILDEGKVNLTQQIPDKDSGYCSFTRFTALPSLNLKSSCRYDMLTGFFGSFLHGIFNASHTVNIVGVDPEPGARAAEIVIVTGSVDPLANDAIPPALYHSQEHLDK